MKKSKIRIYLHYNLLSIITFTPFIIEKDNNYLYLNNHFAGPIIKNIIYKKPYYIAKN